LPLRGGAPGLALNADQFPVVVDDQVAAGVLPERDVEPHAGVSEGCHDRERRSVADILRVFHVVRIAYTSDATIGRAPE
jgi:hypothetical protein